MIKLTEVNAWSKAWLYALADSILTSSLTTYGTTYGCNAILIAYANPNEIRINTRVAYIDLYSYRVSFFSLTDSS
jgi:hypothetical protein